MKQKKLAERSAYCIIPALNEEGTIKKVISGAKKHVKGVIVVDDGSCDRTAAISKKSGAMVVKHSRSMGYAKSIDDGIKFALKRGIKVVVTLDADGQHDSSDIPKMLDLIAKGADIATGTRPYRARLAEYVFSWYSKRKLGIPDPLCGLRAYRADIFRKCRSIERRYSVGTQILFEAKRHGFSIMHGSISLNTRKDSPRFGNRVFANLKIFFGLLNMALRYGF